MTTLLLKPNGTILMAAGEFWEAAVLYIRSLVSIKSSPD